MEKISLIVSCFNEEKTIPLFYEEMENVINTDFNDLDIEFEYIFVNDGSDDKTLEVKIGRASCRERVFCWV